MIEIPQIVRGYSLVRIAAVVYVLVIDSLRLSSAAHPAALVAVMVVVVGWTGLALWCYAAPSRRRPWLFAADLVGGMALVAVGPWVLGAAHADSGVSVVALWLASAPMALALWAGWVWGTLAAAVISTLDLAVTQNADVATWGDKLGLVLLTAGVGYLVSTLRLSARERDTVTATAAAMSERARLARVVHDGVLQVLALVERDAPSLGPRGRRMATAARQQEIELRRLLQESDLSVDDVLDVTVADLAGVLDRHASATVTISTPGDRVLVEHDLAEEIHQAVGEVLANVDRHAGPGARAWVLLEREGAELVVSVRDNGVGGTPEDFDGAFRRGRFGVRHSIYGRLEDLGGVATLRTAPGRGVEWEFRIPRGDEAG